MGFSENFLWGAATAAQVAGMAREDGRKCYPFMSFQDGY